MDNSVVMSRGNRGQGLMAKGGGNGVIYKIVETINIKLKKRISPCPVAMARWISWLECYPIHQKVVGSLPNQGTYLVVVSIPSSGASAGTLTHPRQGTYLGCRFDAPGPSASGGNQCNQSMFLSHINVSSLSLFLPLSPCPSSLPKSINISFSGD